MIVITLKDVAFLLIAGLTLASAVGVCFSRKIVYSGFSLLGTFAGAAGLFVLLSSDLLAVTQLLIYVGGVLILILFAIMLTSKIGDLKLTNQMIHWKMAVPLIGVLAIFLISLVLKGVWVQEGVEVYESVVAPIGNALLSDYILPFEIISIVLLGALIGAIVIARREVK